MLRTTETTETVLCSSRLNGSLQQRLRSYLQGIANPKGIRNTPRFM